jgi:hypothetical protein
MVFLVLEQFWAKANPVTCLGHNVQLQHTAHLSYISTVSAIVVKRLQYTLNYPLYLFYFCGMQTVVLNYHNFSNMSAIATEMFLIILF